mgnify:CR=1 FL=1|tara:strand:- start:326 stop:973 length:648 start_codon:yes stop_codon:yes gene_type:complete
MRPCATTLESELSVNEQKCLTTHLKNSGYTGKHLEIGTAAGGTLWQMLSVFEEGQTPPFVVIDPMSYFPDQFEKVQENLRAHDCDPQAVDFRITDSAIAYAAAYDAKERFDFMLIDGNHKLRYVTEDLRWAGLLNVGGIVCLHDYYRVHIDVMIAADDFLKRNPNYKLVELCDTLLVIRKESESTKPEVGAFNIMKAQLMTPFMQLRRSILKRFK